MTTAVQHRRGTTAEHSTFTGLEGEVTIDTTKDTAVIHDGSLAGGYPLAKETLANVNPSTLSAITGAATASDDLFLMYDTSALAMKKISRAELNNAITIEALDTVDINGGTIDGTAIGGTTPAAGAFTTLSASGSVTLSGGTANAVAFLNGSKVLTSGSALTFDGTQLAIGNTIGTAGIPLTLNVASGNNTNLAFQENQADKWYLRNITGNGGFSFYDVNTGSEAMRLTSTGLGIGTSSPSYKLDVYTGVAGVTQRWNTGSVSMLVEADHSGNGNWYLSPQGSQSFNIKTGGSTRLTLDSSGNLGLGVTPSAWKSSYTGFDIETGSLSSSASVGLVQVAANGYYNSSSQWVYKTSGQKASYYQQYSGEHSWYTAPSGTAGNAISFTQAMTLDSSGRLGIGTSSPAYKLHVARTDAAGTYAYMGASSDGGARGLVFSSADNGAFLGAIHKIDASSGSGVLAFATGGTERARITSSGDLLVGTTNTNTVAYSGFTVQPDGQIYASSSGQHVMTLTRRTDDGDIATFRNSSGTTVGSISVTASATVYNTLSDYRLKEDWVAVANASTRVNALKPVNFAWKVDGKRVDGFLAHELAEVVPEAVTGEKDAVDADGNPVYQGIDQSKLVPLLTAALQEALAEIKSLKARLDAANI